MHSYHVRSSSHISICDVRFLNRFYLLFVNFHVNTYLSFFYFFARSLFISSGWNNLWHNELMEYNIYAWICLFCIYNCVYITLTAWHTESVWYLFLPINFFFLLLFRCYCSFIHNYTYKSSYWWTQWNEIKKIWNEYWVDGNMTGCYCNHRT